VVNDDPLLRLHQLTPRTWVTPAIVALNLLAWLGSVAGGTDALSPGGAELLALGGNRLAETRAEPWRLLTATVLHAGVLHLALNMWALWDTGRVAERFYGNLQFLLLYLLSGLGGSLTSLFFAGKAAVSVGASGAIFGVVGALLAAIWVRPGSLPSYLIRPLRSSLLTFAGVSLLLGVTAGGVDNAAHVGGLLTGLILAAVMEGRGGWHASPRRAFLRLAGALALASVAGFAAWRALA
jgi:rhomboid protease GluP